jgi:diadenosine tetraphosphate (Ap4A) HIT family hydrolase
MCELCNFLNSEAVVGGDEALSIVVPKTAAGAILIIPKQHGSLTELPKQVQEKLLTTASQLSTFIFDNLQVQGTNIIANDEQHGHYIVVGRTENDGLDLRWKPGTTTPAELQETAKRISEETWYIGKEAPKQGPIVEKKPEKIVQHEVVKPKVQTTRSNESGPAVSGSSTRGYVDDDPDVDTVDEIARDIQIKKKKGPKEEHNYLVRQLTRRR